MAASGTGRGWLARLFTFVLVAASLYALACLAFWILQERLVWWPGPAPSRTPDDVGLPFRDLWLETRDGERIHAWLVLPRETSAAAPRGAVLLAHGNAGNIGMRLEYARAFTAMGLAVLLLEYRGYGGSSGRPTEDGTYVDAETAYDHLVAVEGFQGRRIVAFGESLGGAVAIELALRRPVAAVIVEDTFTSAADVGSKLYPWLPVRLLGRVRYDSIGKLGRLDVPLLVLHSPEDDLIPFEHGRRLFEAAREPKRFLPTQGRHDEGGFLLRDDWIAVVRSFVEDALR